MRTHTCTNAHAHTRTPAQTRACTHTYTQTHSHTELVLKSDLPANNQTTALQNPVWNHTSLTTSTHTQTFYNTNSQHIDYKPEKFTLSNHIKRQPSSHPFTQRDDGLFYSHHIHLHKEMTVCSTHTSPNIHLHKEMTVCSTLTTSIYTKR